MTFTTNFKQPRSSKVDRFYKRLELKRAEDRNKADVRRRDKRCRFPLCGCKKMGIALHVSHKVHKGIGGDPTGERSAPELMMLLCACRHKENRVSVDRGTLEWFPITAEGANGPVYWMMDTAGAIAAHCSTGDGWVEIARERSVGVWEPFTAFQRSVLERLAEMRL